MHNPVCFIVVNRQTTTSANNFNKNKTQLTDELVASTGQLFAVAEILRQHGGRSLNDTIQISIVFVSHLVHVLPLYTHTHPHTSRI